MNLSDKILKEESLINYARKVDPINYQDHFNTAWLQFRTKELEELGFQERLQYSYKSYFRTIVKNTFLDSVKSKKLFYIETLPEIESLDVNYQRIQNWFDKDEDKLLRNLVEIMSKCKNKTEAINILNIPRKTFYKLWYKAEKILIEEL